MIAYVDSSALIKLYLDDEAGAERLKEAIDVPESLVTSRLAYVEVRAALPRRVEPDDWRLERMTSP